MPKKSTLPQDPERPEPTARAIDVNFFVLGDLVVDHTIFVSEQEPSHPAPVTGEAAYRVTRRLETAGGAATTARTIDVLTSGQTFLWSHIGVSLWGSFRNILENSQTLDGSISRIDFRGIRDHSDANLVIVSRLVQASAVPGVGERYVRKARFSDPGEIHIPDDSSVKSITHHLRQAHLAKAPISAIVLNDLHLGALHTEVIELVLRFSRDHGIPLIFRSRQDSPKIADIPSLAVVCTLAEWRTLVSTKHSITHWAKNINNPEVADDFCRLTLSAFRNVDYCVILVGDVWIDQVFVVERGTRQNPVSRLHVEAGVASADKGKSQQVGSSDVFAGALAVGCCLDGQCKPRSFASALRYAMDVVEAYQRSGWHQLPPSDKLPSPEAYGNKAFSPAQAARPYATPYLPRTDIIDLSQANSGVPEIYSVTDEVKDALQSVKKALQSDDRSMALVATGGSGKTDIAKWLITMATEQGYYACDFEDLKEVKWHWAKPEATIDSIEQACPKLKDRHIFVVVDEALKKPGKSSAITHGVVLLERAKKKNVRLLLVDADFADLSREKAESQFLSRLSYHPLPAPWERPDDIPYILASCIRRQCTGGETSLSIESAALIRIMEWMLEKELSYRDLNEIAKQVVLALGQKKELVVTWECLPNIVKGKQKPWRNGSLPVYRVKWD